MTYNVEVNWDDESDVWFAVCDEIPVALESGSFDALIEKVKTVAIEILELNGATGDSMHLCFKTTRWESIA